MILKSLRLKDFRNYPDLALTFSEGVNIVEGYNGAGKTNLAEAVHYLAFAKSWRTKEAKALIRDGAQEAYLFAEVSEGTLRREIGIRLSPAGKRITINGHPIRKLSELNDLVNVVLFSPEDATLFKGPPGDRRLFLDAAISKASGEYLNLISDHNRLLEERNAALKAERPDLDYLDVLTERLIAVGEPISRLRARYISRLNGTLERLATALYGEKRSLRIVYRPFIRGENWVEEAKKAYARSKESDLIHKATGIGVQREDFTLLLDGKDISLYGSQGENRLAAIALKLSPFYIVKDEGKKPIAVLDDVYSELDAKHASRLTALLGELRQCFVTGTNIEISGAAHIAVSGHNAVRRN